MESKTVLNVTLDENVERRMEALGVKDAQAKERLVQEVVRAALERLEDTDITGQEAHIEAFLDDAFRGGTLELTDELWQEILAAKPEDAEPGSLAVPPGWQPR